MNEKRKIDVVESKRQGRIVTKEVNKSDPDYELYQHVGEDETLYDELSLDCYWAPDYNDGIVSILGVFSLNIIAPGFVILAAKHSMDLFGTVVLIIFFVMLSSISFLFPCVRWNEKDYATKKICKVVAAKMAVLVVWTAIFTLIPTLTHANFSDDKAAANKYMMLYAIYIALYGIDNFLGVIFLNIREKHKTISSIIDKIYVIIETIVLWGYGAVISILLFKDIRMILLFNFIILLACLGISILNFYLKKNRDIMKVDKAVINGLVKESNRVLIVFLILYIVLLIWWIVCYFTMLR